MRKSAPALEVRPKWARAWAGVNESIKTFNEGEAKAVGGEAKGRRREGGVPKKGWGREVGVDPSEAGIAIRGFLPWESHQRRAELRGSSASAAGKLRRLGGDDDPDGRFGWRNSGGCWSRRTCCVKLGRVLLLAAVEQQNFSTTESNKLVNSCIRSHDADTETFLTVFLSLLQSGRCCYCWSQNMSFLCKKCGASLEPLVPCRGWLETWPFSAAALMGEINPVAPSSFAAC